MMVPVGKIMKKILSLTAAGALATSGILAVQFIRPPEKAEAAPCYSGLTIYRVHNSRCGAAQHFTKIRGKEYRGLRVGRGNTSYSPVCSPYTEEYGVHVYR